MNNFYTDIIPKLYKNKAIKDTIIFIAIYFPYILYTAYPITLIYLAITQNTLFFEFVLKPLMAFLLVTAIRKVVNRPRPYTKLGFTPLISKDEPNESFPSRHSVSAVIIALMFFKINVYLGTLMTIIAFLICLSRVLVRVHYISDVVVAILLAFIIYIS